MEEAENLCEYVIIMDKGKIITEGTLDQLLSKNNATDIIEFTYGNEAALDVDQINIPGCRIEFDNNIKKAKVKFADGKTSQHLHELLDIINNKNINLKSLSCTKSNLEDLFISLTGRKLQD
jgi:ABC-2 type transport system ATP-binding protein